MRVTSVSIRATVQRTAGPRIRFRVASASQDTRYGSYHADH